jgi:hypothetical protein
LAGFSTPRGFPRVYLCSLCDCLTFSDPHICKCIGMLVVCCNFFKFTYMHQFFNNVKTVFLNGVIEEEVYIEKPQGFEVHPRETHVCRLKKVLYGLKQDPRAWYARIDSYLTRLGFSKSYVDPNLYYKVLNDAHVIWLLYVDDLLLIGAKPLIIQCKRELASEFDMKDLGLMHYYLGLEVWQKRGEIFLEQRKYVVKIL